MEYIDLYRRDGTPIGRTIPKKEERAPDEYYLHTHIIFCDQEGRYLLQQRALTQKYLPGKWDVTGGGVMAGETSADAALRELREELGLSLRPEELHFVRRRVDENAGHCLLDMYCAKLHFRPEDCVLQKEEVEAVRLVSFEEFVETVRYNKDEVYLEMLKEADQLLRSLD